MSTQGTEKHHYIGRETLREKYIGSFDQVKSLTKAIADASCTNIDVKLMKNHVIQFIIIGGSKGVEKALKDVKYELEKSDRMPRSQVVFVDESEHKQLQQEKNLFLLTEAALHKFDILTGATQLRQFACGSCSHPWWTFVPRTKPVSTCNSCHVAYDALDRGQEFGIGRYLCLDCDHAFYARCEATEEHICFRCNKLTGPPYINPRFKPKKRERPKLSSDPPPSILKVINESTPHVSTGSTVGSFMTQDLGPDIPVTLAREYHDMAAKDYYQLHKGDPVQYLPDIPFKPVSDDNDDSDQLSVIGEVSDLDSDSQLESEYEVEHSDLDADISHKRAVGSDSDSSTDSSESGEVPTSIQGSDPDSGIGTGSNIGSGTDMETSARLSMICEFNSAEYPGIVFSKRKDEAKMTSSGGEIVGEGAKLIVPPGAVSASDDVTISLQACIGGPFCLPEDLVFLSPVLLIEPPFVFHKNVTLSIKLFVDLEDDCEEIFFFTSPTKHIITEDNKVEWKFKKYKSPMFNIEDNIGEIDLKHFCFGAFGGRKRKYSYWIFLHTPSLFTPPQSHLIFSVTLRHEVYTKNLERYIEATFGKEKFAATTKLIKFSASGISLKLPLEDVERQGFDLTPDKSPCKIMKEEVDCGKKETITQISLYPPRIILRISLRDQERIGSILTFVLEVEGIQEEVAFPISLPLSPTMGISSKAHRTDSSSSSSSSIDSHSGGSLRQQSSSSQGSQEGSLKQQSSSGYSSQGSQEAVDITRSNRLDEEPDLKSLINYLYKIAPKWEDIAVQLDLDEEISKIDSDGRNVNDKLRKVLSTWKRRRPKCCNWQTIIEMLERDSIQEHALAQRIKNDLTES